MNDIYLCFGIFVLVFAFVVAALLLKYAIQKKMEDHIKHFFYDCSQPEYVYSGNQIIGIYGYKWLIRENKRFYSYANHVYWNNNCLKVNMVPTHGNSVGIYFTKNPKYVELENFFNDYILGNFKAALVKCILYGTILETEYGFRAERAKIVEVLEER